jgi:predicted house-cleaning noncanonical NTP pyrophosphatase (MazG superfamily)
MTVKKFDKLVRDRIPEIILSNGKQCKIEIATPEEYEQKLNEKLVEEVQEFIENPCLEELADIQEVVSAISNLNKWNVWDARLDKNIESGAFKNRYILKEVSE